MDNSLATSCKYFYDFYNEALSPCVDDLLDQLSTPQTTKLFAIEKTLVLASTLDYIRPIWDINHPLPKEKKWQAHQVAEDYDKLFNVHGANFINYKFRLIHGMANAIKHRKLNPSHDLQYNYGTVTYQTLIEQDGVVFFNTPTYKFDYCRVILRPICESFQGWEIEEENDVSDWLNRDITRIDDGDMPNDDPIDAMIDACHPACLDCGEDGDDCMCNTYSFDDQQGDFQPNTNPMFDFDATMSRISGAYRKE